MDLVLIYWLDSRQPSADWVRLDSMEPEGVCYCRSVGWLVSETETAVVLVPNIADVGNDPQGCGLITIPVKCIQSRKIMEKYSCATIDTR